MNHSVQAIVPWDTVRHLYGKGGFALATQSYDETAARAKFLRWLAAR